MRLYSTLSRELEELPAPPGPIRMYFCGPTVYQRAHIGNARPFVIGMWLRSWLRAQGYDATLVHNITDVNDKIYDAAPGASAELAARATEWYLEDTGDLGLGMPDVLPKATDAVPSIVEFISKLVDSGHAYPVDGDVYFRVASDPGYGRLSRQRPDQVEEQEPNPLKEDPRDFALWKANKPGEDTAWDSPWGRGRPGWHIECSAMAEDAFGPAFEIHGGGLDLVFPHHENELAQSSALGHDFASIWMHNGMLDFGAEKMSKSLGNDVSIRNVLDTWGPDVVLLFFMTAHWRKPIDFGDEVLEQAKAQLEGFEDATRQISREAPQNEWARLVTVLDDDFDTPGALAVLNEWRSAGYHALVEKGLALFGIRPLRTTVLGESHLALQASLGTSGVVAPSNVQYLGSRPPDVVFEKALLRYDARAGGDYSTADALRVEVEDLGFRVDDLPDGYVIVPIHRQRSGTEPTSE
ncbi:MAG: cysteinyl-tRNA synthetase [Gaiellaceae bacterium]|jgi:cysteinyl-tRNA synthetase|nr:cysteinyl-tRNA synthetase [Gaiellaceae bacterium]